MVSRRDATGNLPRFGRGEPCLDAPLTRLGSGPIGGKASGLAQVRDAVVRGLPPERYGGLRVDVPRGVVVAAEVFETLLDRNGLRDPAATADLADDRIAHRFQRAEFPAEWAGDLVALASRTRAPLAVRSSGVLEDDADRPFAGVYATKMTANHQPEPAERFERLVEAIKFVYASARFGGARDYAAAAGEERHESMAVLLQEVVGTARERRWYPDISGVARSRNLFPAAGMRREDGIVHLALGLGKTIVDGGACWSFSPMSPQAPPPFATTRDLLKGTQREFWAIRMAAPAVFDPTREDEWIERHGLDVAEFDGTLAQVASTWQAERDRLVPGVSGDGPRAVTFAPLLAPGGPPFAPLVRDLLAVCEDATGAEVEAEFAATFDRRGGGAGQVGLLQVRPLATAAEVIEVGADDLEGADVLVASTRAIGNARRDDLTDVVYLVPGLFDPAQSSTIATDVRTINGRLRAEGRRCVLIGFGRWGSADPWLGVPVDWSSIAQAAVVVEVDRGDRAIEPSQGSHFFHNLTAFQVSYLTVGRDDRPPVDWDALERAPEIASLGAVRWVRFARPFDVRVDGRTGRAVIRQARTE